MPFNSEDYWNDHNYEGSETVDPGMLNMFLSWPHIK